MEREALIRDIAELIVKLGVPISLDGEMKRRGGPTLLHTVQEPWTRLHVELVGFGYGEVDEVADCLREALA